MAFLRSQQREWQQRYRLQRIDLFGSTARNVAMASNDLVRLRVNPALWNTEDRKDREPCTKSCTKALKNPGQAWVLRMEPSGLEPLTPCMPCRCSTS